MLEVIVVKVLDGEPTTETVVMGNGPEVRLAKTRVREGVTENPHLVTMLPSAGFNLCSANQCGSSWYHHPEWMLAKPHVREGVRRTHICLYLILTVSLEVICEFNLCSAQQLVLKRSRSTTTDRHSSWSQCPVPGTV